MSARTDASRIRRANAQPMPYLVSYSWGNGYKRFATLEDAIEFARSRPNDISVRVFGDGHDIDWDGLTDEERELVEEALS